MRIIGGSMKGRRFDPPAKNWPTRPTTDISKEGLFNILQNRIDFSTTRMLDLFGGTGNHCYEFISRGCTDATYVDRHRPAVAFVEKTAKEFNIEDKLTIIRADVLRFLKQSVARPYDYAFAGPPYGMARLDDLPDLVLGGGWIAPKGIFVLEHNPRHDFTNHPRFTEVRQYGETHFAFFSPKIADEEE